MDSFLLKYFFDYLDWVFLNSYRIVIGYPEERKKKSVWLLADAPFLLNKSFFDFSHQSGD
jgi:hypothetical protein